MVTETQKNIVVVVEVKWSACSPSIPMIQVQIQLKSSIFIVKKCLKKEKINKKRPQGWLIIQISHNDKKTINLYHVYGHLPT